jgi:SAM-dependent methyltransferase
MNGPEASKSTGAPARPDFGAVASLWARSWAGLAMPARQAVAQAAAIGISTKLLDIGCGTGEFCRLADARGADVSGVDVAAGMIEIAHRQLPAADLRVGAIEDLPWPDDTFDLVTAFNAFQFATDIGAAFTEATRVLHRRGRLAICNWGRPQHQSVNAVTDALRALLPSTQPSIPERPAVGEPGVLEDLVSAAGCVPSLGGEVDVPYLPPDLAAVEQAFLVDAFLLGVTEHAGEEAIRTTIDAAALPFRQPDGSYRFDNRFRYLIAIA